MNKQLKDGLFLHTFVCQRNGETYYVIYDQVGEVYSTIFPERLERFYKV